MENFNEDFDFLSKKLKKTLKKNRYIHSLGVAFTAANLAGIYSDEEQPDKFIAKAMIAGLLHDCARCYSDDELLKIAEKNNLPIYNAQRNNPSLLHAAVGVIVAENEYGITDKEILSAIQTHTTGIPAMSLLQKIIFVADYIEPGRKFHNALTKIRYLANTDLNKCVCEICNNTINYVKSKNQIMDPQTKATGEYYAGEKHDY